MSEFHLKYRPRKLSGLVGQAEAVSVLEEMISARRVPHSILLTGPSGTGKTTIARILAKAVGATGTDMIEMNAANYRGIDMVRDIANRMNLAAWEKSRCWIVDECHQLSKDAQEAFLKPLEEPPGHVYFFLCTTDPSKLIATLRNRLTEVKLKRVSQAANRLLLKRISEKEEFNLTDDVRDRIITLASGSPRQAVVMLNKIVGLDGEEEQLAALDVSDNGKDLLLELALALLHKAKWVVVSKLLSKLQAEPEDVRRMVLFFMAANLSKPKVNMRAALIMDQFSSIYEDAGTARALLSLDCYKVVHWKAS